MGSRQPEFNGIYWPIKHLRQYRIALLVIDFGALVFPTTSHPVPLKSNFAVLFSLSIVNVRFKRVPSSIVSREHID